ncbi:DUF1056 family protein [Ornithinibacillus xuwenensis]|uniref:Uncharacterized protein n=1 Tax=Ornithinibacillus xuwenensis TaxID=3144668 RepID=A0ABU9XBN7_9BACI
MKQKVLNYFNNTFKKVFLYLDDILLFIGIALISVGVFKIYIPAGYITLGILVVLFAYVYARSKEGDHG